MKKGLIWVVCLPLVVGAQVNLAPNPSFEDYGTCPTFYSTIDVYTDAYVTDWFRPNDGSSDYMNACDAGEVVGVPTSIFDDYQPARTGEAYVGFWSYLISGNYREYVQAQLTEPLIADNCYYVEFWVSPATRSDFSTDNWTCDCIGMYISEDRPLSTLYSYTPQITTPAGSFYTDTSGWTMISGIYIAEGGEEWISIGNFNEDDETEVFDFLGEGASPYVYMFAEDVLVTELTDFNALSDTVVCAGETVILDVPAGAGTYLWSTGDTGSSISVTTTGTYWVSLETPCGVFSDTADVIFSIDDVLTSSDTITICHQALPYTIDPDAPYITQVWNTGDTTLQLTIEEQGIYILNGYASCQAFIDTFYVEVLEQVPNPMLLNDTLICALSWSFTAEVPGFDTYAWNTGSTLPAITVTEEGLYFVTYTNTCDSYTDSMLVTIDPYLGVDLSLGPDTLICPLLGEQLVLQAGAELPSYTWSTGETTASIVVTEAGIYWVSASTVCRDRSDSILVSPCVIIDVPNAFSPNGDGTNDFFTVLCSDCNQFVSLQIFNRWGEMVFETNDPLVGWDGTHQQQSQPLGSYAYVLTYLDAGATAIKQGHLTLVR